MTYKQLAQKITKAILEDLTDRRGLKQQWEQIDDEIKQEIVNKWTDIAHRVLRKEV